MKTSHLYDALCGCALDVTLWFFRPTDPHLAAHSRGDAAHHTVPHLRNTVSPLPTDAVCFRQGTETLSSPLHDHLNQTPV